VPPSSRDADDERWIAEQLPAAISALTGPGHTLPAAFAGAVKDKPGLYAVYGDPAVWSQLGLGAPPDERPLYVGKAEDSLVTRDLDTHFTSGDTGRSSPRRSFAALLVDELALVAIPRRPENPEPKHWPNYALEADGDDRLTEWMREHLTLAVWPCDQIRRLTKIEKAVMGHWGPPLNLTGVKQPWKKQVRDARGAMVIAAKAWARARGHQVDP
jgi:hypothetical protein